MTETIKPGFLPPDLVPVTHPPYDMGDIYYADSTTSLARLPVGAAGTQLLVDGSDYPSWVEKGYVNVKESRFGALGNGVADDTAAISAAVQACSSGGAVFFPSGTYIINPTASLIGADTGGRVVYYVAKLASNIKISGNGATIKLKDNWSTNANPKELGVFICDTSLADVTIRDMIYDFNGSNQGLGSPAPTVGFHAALVVTGTDNRISQLTVENCKHYNSIGSNLYVTGLTNVSSILAHQQTFRHNYFYNCGTGVEDFTAIYAWAEDVLIDGNYFLNISPPVTIVNSFELHGSCSKAINNVIVNYSTGGMIADNTTTINYGSEINNNYMYVNAYGALLWSGMDAGGQLVGGAKFCGNHIYFNNTTNPPPALAGYQTGIRTFVGNNTSGLEISGNTINGEEAIADRQIIGLYLYCDDTGSKLTDIKITNNHFYRLTRGVNLRSLSYAGTIGSIVIANNTFTNLTWAGIEAEFITALPADRIIIYGNSFYDSGLAVMDHGIGILGHISNLGVYANNYLGMQAENYYEYVASDASPSLIDARIEADSNNLYPNKDNTYYLGKNSISSPLAFRGATFKDTTNGNYYRVEVISGVLTATQIT